MFIKILLKKAETHFELTLLGETNSIEDTLARYIAESLNLPYKRGDGRLFVLHKWSRKEKEKFMLWCYAAYVCNCNLFMNKVLSLCKK